MSTIEFNGTTGRLPDALAFVKPNRAEFWVALRDEIEPKTVPELVKSMEHSTTTVYRMIDELQDLGLVEQSIRIEGSPPTNEYRALDPIGTDTRDTEARI